MVSHDSQQFRIMSELQQLSVSMLCTDSVTCCHLHLNSAAATEMEGVCRAPGVQGGLAMLSRLQEGPLARVLLTGIPAQGGFNAVYLGMSFNHACGGSLVFGLSVSMVV